MYSSCLFCSRDLGRNTVLSGFPVGKRIAFDSARGRLWVVCRGCERWNLTPLEERWEAVEQAEEFYQDSRRRAASGQIGLARIPGGVELVRIGQPLRPEFAAWRYGDQFGRRRIRRMLYAGAGVAAIGAGAVSGLVAGVAIASFGGIAGPLLNGVINGNENSVVARLITEEHGTVSVRRRHLAETRIVPGKDAAIALDLRFKNGEAQIEGAEALRIAGVLMPHINRFGGKRRVVESAVGTLERSGGPEGYIEQLARYAHTATDVPKKSSGKRKPKKSAASGAFVSGLFGLTPTDRLALEMALHEEAEMRALRGQLADLERAWQEAEEIAAIADDLLVPTSIRAALARMRSG